MDANRLKRAEDDAAEDPSRNTIRNSNPEFDSGNPQGQSPGLDAHPNTVTPPKPDAFQWPEQADPEGTVAPPLEESSDNPADDRLIETLPEGAAVPSNDSSELVAPGSSDEIVTDSQVQSIVRDDDLVSMDEAIAYPNLVGDETSADPGAQFSPGAGLNPQPSDLSPRTNLSVVPESGIEHYESPPKTSDAGHEFSPELFDAERLNRSATTALPNSSATETGGPNGYSYPRLHLVVMLQASEQQKLFEEAAERMAARIDKQMDEKIESALNYRDHMHAAQMRALRGR